MVRQIQEYNLYTTLIAVKEKTLRTVMWEMDRVYSKFSCEWNDLWNDSQAFRYSILSLSDCHNPCEWLEGAGELCAVRMQRMPSVIPMPV